MTRGAGDRGDAAHEGAADAEDVDVHYRTNAGGSRRERSL
jgi:hypothetical protein